MELTNNHQSPSSSPLNKRYFNRELSWLAFNSRVLEQAKCATYPLLERIRFLSFVSSNLDEFFEIRVAGLIQQIESDTNIPSIDGLSAKEQIPLILHQTKKLVDEQYDCWEHMLSPDLRKEGIFFKAMQELTPHEFAWLENYFEEQVFPVLTPLAIDPSHPFPQLLNKGLNILVWLNQPEEELENKHRIMAVIPVPRILPRIIPIKPENSSSEHTYVFLSDILREFASRLFPGYPIEKAWEFRITRNSDLYLNEEEVGNILEKIEEELYNLKRGAAVRLEIRKDVDDELLNQLLEAIHLSKEFVFKIDGPLNLLRLFSTDELIKRPDLKFPNYTPFLPAHLAKPENLFNLIAQEDILLHHPYDSFTPIVEFIEQAAKDPNVFAIKQTLYRTSGGSPIVEALKEASRNGKQVTVLVELKARFDEANNIAWARQLEEEGVHVVYGLVKLKTHCKCCLVVRGEQGKLVRYAHLGTGNYNVKTARSYTDLSLFTANPELTEEIAKLFNTLTGFSKKPQFDHLLVAPFNYQSRLLGLIQREQSNALTGKPAKIIAKINSLSDKTIIDALYEASSAGVKIELIVRGICCLIPAVPGLSENITVRSILGRYLEHSRIYYFENTGNEPDLFLGSGDWMPRNFERRIEAIFPVLHPKLKKRVINKYLLPFLKDTQNATQLTPSGTYQKHTPKTPSEAFSIQDYLMQRADKLKQTEGSIGD